jgi:hypothetical protein
MNGPFLTKSVRKGPFIEAYSAVSVGFDRELPLELMKGTFLPCGGKKVPFITWRRRWSRNE